MQAVLVASTAFGGLPWGPPRKRKNRVRWAVLLPAAGPHDVQHALDLGSLAHVCLQLAEVVKQLCVCDLQLLVLIPQSHELVCRLLAHCSSSDQLLKRALLCVLQLCKLHLHLGFIFGSMGVVAIIVSAKIIRIIIA